MCTTIPPTLESSDASPSTTPQNNPSTRGYVDLGSEFGTDKDWTNDPTDLLIGTYFGAAPNVGTDYGVEGLIPIIKQKTGDMFLLQDKAGRLYMWNPWVEGLYRIQGKTDSVEHILDKPFHLTALTTMALWDNFGAFGRSLDKSILQHTIDPASGDRILESDIMKFFLWIRGVHDHPETHGIPSNRQEDVVKLIDGFFPLAPDPKARLPPVRTLDKETPAGASRRLAMPLTVHYGPSDKAYDITDAGSALGYIFSVALPPPNQPMTAEGYYLPMLVLFAECLYLAFISDEPGSPVLSNIPIMVCVMYGCKEGTGDPVYTFGSTWTSINSYKGSTEVENWERKIMMDDWRRDAVLDGCKAWAPLDPLPRLDPLSKMQLAKIFWSFFRGRFLQVMQPPYPPAMVDGADTMIQAMKVVYDTAWRAATKPPPTTLSVMLKEDLLLDNERTRDTLRPIIFKLIDLRFSPDYSRKGSSDVRKAAYFELLKFYLTPHSYPSQTDDLPPLTTGVEIPAPVPDPVDAAVIAAWAVPGTADTAADILDLLFDACRQHDIELSRPYGRCAETYPSISARPYFFPSAAPAAASVKGLALETRILGKATQAFQNSFDLEALQSTKSLKPPCLSCKSLLSAVKMDLVLYNEDLKRIGG
ncbi:hypothetical protein BX600DRAFT_555920 [Xylariales sp. PMI_506]|nr:hypothetical protein BX600DRAFT_555920 [Xylariales sp. PMI_506]